MISRIAFVVDNFAFVIGSLSVKYSVPSAFPKSVNIAISINGNGLVPAGLEDGLRGLSRHKIFHLNS